VKKKRFVENVGFDATFGEFLHFGGITDVPVADSK